MAWMSVSKSCLVVHKCWATVRAFIRVALLRLLLICTKSRAAIIAGL